MDFIGPTKASSNGINEPSPSDEHNTAASHAKERHADRGALNYTGHRMTLREVGLGLYHSSFLGCMERKCGNIEKSQSSPPAWHCNVSDIQHARIICPQQVFGTKLLLNILCGCHSVFLCACRSVTCRNFDTGFKVLN